jgi:1,5-anhydro-D-fructose reductase (1,5-anhydro-D-mannitol-forming)
MATLTSAPASTPSPARPTGFLAGRKVVRWGIIGCGDVTEVKSGPGFQKAAGSALVAVMRRNGALAADYAKRHGVARSYDNAAALIADPEVDAVYVATPPDSHASYALQVAAAGKPAYIEKPMARNTAECDRMVDAFARAKLPLFVAYYRRSLPRFLEAQKLIAEGAIGKVTGVRYQGSGPKHRDDAGWRLDAGQAGGGHFLDVGSHVLDLLDFLFGPLADVAGSAANLGGTCPVEDVVAMSFRFGSGLPGSAAWNFASAVTEDAVVITGTEGRLTFAVFTNEPLQLENGKGTQAIDRPNPPHVAQPLIQTVVDDLLGRAPCPSTGASARRTTQVMDTVLAGYYGGRNDEFWLRPQSWPGGRR